MEPTKTPLNPADAGFSARLGEVLPDGVLHPPEPRYLEEPRGGYTGQIGVLALPRDVDQVAVLLSAANEARVPVLPYGGGTGLKLFEINLRHILQP